MPEKMLACIIWKFLFKNQIQFCPWKVCVITEEKYFEKNSHKVQIVEKFFWNANLKIYFEDATTAAWKSVFRKSEKLV